MGSTAFLYKVKELIEDLKSINPDLIYGMFLKNN